MRFQRSGIAALLATLTCTAVLAADDISGVALGSSLAVAKEAIAEANPNFKLSPLMLRDGKEAGVTAVTADRLKGTGISNSGGPSDEFAALQNDAGKVWFIARVQRFEDGSRIKTEALKAALTEKFGKPSNITQMMSLGLVWQYDRDGKQYFGPSSEGPCKGVRSASSNIPGVSFPAPQSFSPTCGKIIEVGASEQPDEMVPHYTVSIIDVKSMFDELAARDANAEADRNKKLSDEQAKNVKPKI